MLSYSLECILEERTEYAVINYHMNDFIIGISKVG